MTADLPPDVPQDDSPEGNRNGIASDLAADDDPPGTSVGPRPQLGDFGASEAEQRKALGIPDEDDRSDA
jgi:hypothetical protein